MKEVKLVMRLPADVAALLALDDLLRAGLRLSASLHRQILTDAGEA